MSTTNTVSLISALLAGVLPVLFVLLNDALFCDPREETNGQARNHQAGDQTGTARRSWLTAALITIGRWIGICLVTIMVSPLIPAAVLAHAVALLEARRGREPRDATNHKPDGELQGSGNSRAFSHAEDAPSKLRWKAD